MRLEHHSHLLNTRDMSSNVFNCNGVFDGKSVALTLYSGLVDEHSTVGGETCEIRIVSQLVGQGRYINTHQRRLDKRDRRA